MKKKNDFNEIFDNAKTPPNKRKHLFTSILNFTFDEFQLNSCQTFLTTVYEGIFGEVF